jgi:glycolate oxidase iron-sulfur subunit
MDSPRGRIYLMRAAAEGRTAIDASYVKHFDACLGCLSCVTACPSGVQYAPLIEAARAQIEERFERPAGDSTFRRALMALVPYPSRMRIALLPLAIVGPLVRAVGRALGGNVGRAFTARRANAKGSPNNDRREGILSRVAAAMAVAPPVTFRSLFSNLPDATPAHGEERMRVALLTGCVQRLAFDEVNRATVRVLSAEGCRVDAPGAQGCCGALALHAGYADQARALARANIAVFEQSGAERIVVNAAGCGSAMKEYGVLFEDDPAWADRARAFSAKVRDVSEVLAELGPARAERHPVHARVVYHDACHLAHGQGVRAEPRALLQAIPGVELTTPAEAEICCGSAGIYNLVQPAPAAALGARKATQIALHNPDMIATANPGCMLQIAAAARGFGYNWPIFHPIQIVDASIRGADPRTDGGW